MAGKTLLEGLSFPVTPLWRAPWAMSNPFVFKALRGVVPDVFRAVP